MLLYKRLQMIKVDPALASEPFLHEVGTDRTSRNLLSPLRRFPQLRSPFQLLYPSKRSDRLLSFCRSCNFNHLSSAIAKRSLWLIALPNFAHFQCEFWKFGIAVNHCGVIYNLG